MTSKTYKLPKGTFEPIEGKTEVKDDFEKNGFTVNSKEDTIMGEDVED